MTRIVHVLPRLIGGGPERSVLALASATAGLGVEQHHTLVVLDPPVTPRMVVAARRLGMAVVVRPDVAALQNLVARADIVQVHYWNHPDLLDLLRTVELPPARIIVWSRVLGTTAPQVLTADVGRFADHLVVTTELSRATAGALAVEDAGRPVSVIPGVADMGRLDGFAPRPHDGCVVGYLGVVNDTKMHPRFAELCARVTHPDVRFVVVGGGGGESALAARADALGLAGRLEVRGPTEHIRSALEQFDVFGYPLAAHTWATSEKALQEAMWVGVPPVVFPYGGLARLVEHQRTGLVVSSEDGYVAAIERLAGDLGLRARLGDAARNFARAEFDPMRWARAALALVDQVMADPRRSRPCLPGAGTGAAAGFVASLGDEAGPFAVSLAGVDGSPEGPGPVNTTGPVDISWADRAIAPTEAADATIAASDATLAYGEGGVVHHRNRFPDDPHLRLWSGLLAAARGDGDLAVTELDAAAGLGLGDQRPDRYRAQFDQIARRGPRMP